MALSKLNDISSMARSAIVAAAPVPATMHAMPVIKPRAMAGVAK